MACAYCTEQKEKAKNSRPPTSLRHSVIELSWVLEVITLGSCRTPQVRADALNITAACTQSREKKSYRREGKLWKVSSVKECADKLLPRSLAIVSAMALVWLRS